MHPRTNDQSILSLTGQKTMEMGPGCLQPQAMLVLYTWRGVRQSNVPSEQQQNDFGCWQPLSFRWVLTAEDRKKGHGNGGKSQAPPLIVQQHGGTDVALRHRQGECVS